MKPKIKTVYPVYRVREDLLRIGAEPGITADVEESHGEMARFLSLLDGQKDIKEVTRAMQEEFPEITEQDVLEGIQVLASLGLLVNGEHAPHKLSDRDLERHSRNLNFFEHFADLETNKYSFQEKLRESTVTIIGAGGHGSSIAFQLAALGVGKLRLIDGDVVELSNLNRQVFFREKDVGRPKVFALAQHLKEFYSDLEIQTINGFAYQRLDELIRGSELVICAADQPCAQLATATLEAAASWSLRRAEKLIEQNEDSHTGYIFGVLCAKCDRLIGLASLGFIDRKNRSGYVGLVIGDSSHRGLGIGKQALSLLLDFAFGELALHRVYGEVLATNKISARMVDSLGFALEGVKREACFRNGVFLDVYIYGLLAREWSANKESEFRG